VHNFAINGMDGVSPVSNVIKAGGNLYGTTMNGGSSGHGTIFKIGKFGAEQVLYSFRGSPDGAYPAAGLKYVNGHLYGTTYYGGNTACRGDGCGTVFEASLSGVTRVLYRFRGSTAGWAPFASLTDVGGTLYGTTRLGGVCPDCGTVFSVSTSGIERVLYRFRGGKDGAYVDDSGLIDVNGTLYGTTVYGGGTGCQREGCGTVFSISTSGAERVLYRFGGDKDGCTEPYGGLAYLNGSLYGTTALKYQGAGCVFRLSTSGAFQLLYSFKGRGDGEFPGAPLTSVDGVLYGTTSSGGGSSCPGNGGCGVIFSVTTSGTERVIQRFRGRDGAEPEARLTNVEGTLYGTTRSGGTYRAGTVFSIKP
jgi:uncharacterized repeat protein (TIGR03803 family)